MTSAAGLLVLGDNRFVHATGSVDAIPNIPVLTNYFFFFFAADFRWLDMQKHATTLKANTFITYYLDSEMEMRVLSKRVPEFNSRLGT